MMIECQHLRKVYRNGDLDTVALDDVSFGIERGEFVSIIGPSGSGKSTLMHIVGALDVPTSGSYLFDGRDVSKLNDDALSELRKEKSDLCFSRSICFLAPRCCEMSCCRSSIPLRLRRNACGVRARRSSLPVWKRENF